MSTETPSVMAVIDACERACHPLSIAAGKPLLEWAINGLADLPPSSPIFVFTDCDRVSSWMLDYVTPRLGGRTICTMDLYSGPPKVTDERRFLTALELAESHFQLTADVAVLRQASAPLVESHTVDALLRELSENKADAAIVVHMFGGRLWKASYEDRTVIMKAVELPTVPEASWIGTSSSAVCVVNTRSYRQHGGQLAGKVVGVYVSAAEMIDLSDDSGLPIAETALRQRVNRFREEQLPNPIDAVVFDFDGVFTDNRVWVTQDGQESAACDRGDGMGIGLLKKTGIPLLVLSKEPVPIVVRRCEKLGLECLHGVDDKLPLLKAWLEERGLALGNTIYMGNDVNDRECLAAAGCGVVPSDGHPDVMPLANMVLDKRGGHGAVRQLCDLILKHLAK